MRCAEVWHMEECDDELCTDTPDAATWEVEVAGKGAIMILRDED